ncbi:MAG TPA: hypothetical protein VGJ22_06910, partial [Anaerolineales bacterium]
MTDESQLPPSQPHREPGVEESEPTVLDYFKSVTKDWPSFITFLRSLIEIEQRAQVNRAVAEQARLQAEPELVEEPLVQPARPGRFTWRAGAALLLALMAQFLLEPPGANAELGVALYAFAAGLVALSFFRDEWQIVP